MEDIAAALEGLKGRVQALYATGDPLVNAQRLPINTFARRALSRRCSRSGSTSKLGGLMPYGPNFLDLNRRSADYVDKILRGATPADLPVEQPTKFELVINRKTASALGVELPQSLLLRADQVID